MTIAVCHVSPEGVVLGADSTSSCITDGPGGSSHYHYFNNEQKIFEVGESSSLGVATWGLGSVGNTSHRTLIARLADTLKSKKPGTVKEAADRWSSLFWKEYAGWIGSPQCGFGALKAKKPFDPTQKSQSPGFRTEQEERLFHVLTGRLYVGFVIGGYVGQGRDPFAYSLEFSPLATAAPSPTELAVHSTSFWGVPNVISRLLRGYDDNVLASIEASGKWAGTRSELINSLAKHSLVPGHLPVRDAIDYVHTCVSSTIKALKFAANQAQVCGGPVEVAVLTTDRRFRWVKHKRWDTGIEEGNSE